MMFKLLSLLQVADRLDDPFLSEKVDTDHAQQTSQPPNASHTVYQSFDDAEADADKDLFNESSIDHALESDDEVNIVIKLIGS